MHLPRQRSRDGLGRSARSRSAGVVKPLWGCHTLCRVSRAESRSKAGSLHCIPRLAAVGGLCAVKVGIDVGGTFTDSVALDESTGALRWSKVPTTPTRFIDGVLDGLRALDVPSAELDGLVVHATTIG